MSQRWNVVFKALALASFLGVVLFVYGWGAGTQSSSEKQAATVASRQSPSSLASASRTSPQDAVRERLRDWEAERAEERRSNEEHRRGSTSLQPSSSSSSSSPQPSSPSPPISLSSSSSSSTSSATTPLALSNVSQLVKPSTPETDQVARQSGTEAPTLTEADRPTSKAVAPASCASHMYIPVPSAYRQKQEFSTFADKLCAVEELVSPMHSALPPPPPLAAPLHYSQPDLSADEERPERTVTGTGSFRRWPAPRCVVPAIMSGYVSGERGVVFNATHALTNGRWHRRELPPASASTIIELNVPVVNLVIQWGEEYQHAVLETLPRLALVYAALLGKAPSSAQDTDAAVGSCLREASEDIGHFLSTADWGRAVVLHSPGQAVRRLLQEGLGLPPSRLLAADPRATYHAPVAIFPTLAHQAKIGVMPPGAYGPLLTRLQTGPLTGGTGAEGAGGAGTPLLLYLRRESTQARGLSADVEAQLVGQLQKRLAPGLELHLWDVSSSAVHNFETDASIFARARVIVGPHGGAFANLIFTPPGADVVEIIPRASMEMQAPEEPKRDVRPCYHALSGALGLRYHQFEPEPVGESRNFFDAKGLRLDVARLSALLAELGVLTSEGERSAEEESRRRGGEIGQAARTETLAPRSCDEDTGGLG